MGLISCPFTYSTVAAKESRPSRRRQHRCSENDISQLLARIHLHHSGGIARAFKKKKQKKHTHTDMKEASPCGLSPLLYLRPKKSLIQIITFQKERKSSHVYLICMKTTIQQTQEGTVIHVNVWGCTQVQCKSDYLTLGVFFVCFFFYFCATLLYFRGKY